MGDVSLDVNDILWYDDSRWWMFIVYISPDVMSGLDVNVGDYFTLKNGDEVIVEGEVILVSDNSLSVKTREYIWLEGSGAKVAAVSSKYEISKSILSVVDECDVVLSPSDIRMFDVGDDVEVWVGSRKVVTGYNVGVDDGVIGRSIRVYGYGRRLTNIYVNLIYYEKDLFEIVKDMVERVTDLTVVGDNTGVVLDRFVAKDYLLNIIEDLAHIVGYQIRVEGKTLYFEELGNEDAGMVLDSSNCRFGKWNVDMRQIVNELYLAGGELTYHYVDEFTGDGNTTEFKLTYRPTGNIKVEVNGESLLANVDYTIDEEKPSITFKNPPPSSTANNIVVSYDYGIGVLVKVKNDDSIAKYGVHDKKIKFDWVKDFDTAKDVAWGVIGMFSEPYMDVEADVVLPKFISGDIDIGKKVHCIDDVSKRDVWMVVKGIEYHSKNVRLKLGSTLMTFDAWVSEVDERLRMLEKERLGTDVITQYSMFSEGIAVTLSKVLYTMKVKKIIGGLMFNRGEIGLTPLGVSYGEWEVVF